MASKLVTDRIIDCGGSPAQLDTAIDQDRATVEALLAVPGVADAIWAWMHPADRTAAIQSTDERADATCRVRHYLMETTR